MFKELFTEIEVDKKDITNNYYELPVVMLSDGQAYFSNKGTVDKIVFGSNFDEEVLKIPIYENTEDQLEYHLGCLLLSAATDRNMIVYDSEDKTNTLTSKLITLLSSTLRKNSDNTHKIILTNLFMMESESNGLDMHGVKVHEVNDDLWTRLEDFYLNQLQGCFAAEDKNLVLGLCASQNDDLIIIKSSNYIGSAVLSSKCLILGSF